MQIMFININEGDGKIEYLLVPKGLKFTGSGKLGLTDVKNTHVQQQTALIACFFTLPFISFIV